MFTKSLKLSYFVIFFLNFLTGVEYAVILPTALQFLQKYGGNEVDLGFCLSAYSFSSLFSSPIMGRWSDKTHNVKLIMIVANFFQIIGSFMYFMGVSTWFIISGRIVAGIGLGVVSASFSDVIKNTREEDRSPILSRIMVGRQIGMIIGPAFNFLLLNLNFKIGPFVLDKLSAPGLFMTLAWTILQIFVILFYTNLSEFNQVEQTDERTRLLNSNGGSSYNSIRIVDNSETDHFIIRLYNEYIREEIVAIYCSTFTVFFMQTVLETMLTPFTKDYFKWSDIENSILYGLAGLEIMIVFIFLSFLSKKYKDRTLLFIGLCGNLSTLIFLIIYLPMVVPDPNNLTQYILFIIPVFANVFSLPFIVLASISLLSKITSIHSQGLSQGIRRTVVGLACILGPNWAGAFYKQWFIMIGVLILLLLMSLIMSILSFNKLSSGPINKSTSLDDSNDNQTNSINN
ncbi:unnamed protein product [Brachionus calyciflorus]|uniref:Major facilitator superfamily (MFS) profile domain-containing protein n=1 Tax=Brachionus calyciflorus TaxID=104777 RepID=A0A814FDE5_9BILA|nr:unnamed protein product [Brachionus calyciflorus]